MALFLDLLHLSADATDGALEYIYKSVHEHGDEGIWKPHDSPLVQRMIELFTERGLMRLDAVKTALLDWESGAKHVPSPHPVPAPGMMARWNESERAIVMIYLQSLPPAAWTIDDHMLAVEWVVQEYVPAEALKTEAEWLAVRSSLMGKVQANMEKPATVKQADAILAAMPSTVAGAVQQFNLNGPQRAALEFAAARAAENVQALSDGVRHKMRAAILQDLEQRMIGALPPGASSLQTKLFDEFATLNRDWRRIAVTEAGEAQLQGYIASLKPGTKVKRVERYDNACSFCRSINGRIMTVVAADHPDKDPDTQIWPGKNNVGRSASPRKRVGDVLVEREPHEMWQVPAGLVHPHCRGRWEPVIEDEFGEDPEFGAKLRALFD